jgi:glycosyltransferase involved in cell wall biosynthesis
MATTPYFVISPNTIVSLLGLMRGPDKTVPTPGEDWRQATVDVVIPALNEERNIVFCLDSLARQTLKPKRIILIDDGSRDRTCENARAYAESVGMDLTVIKRKAAIGKTPTIKRQAREFDSDVEFILDGDTVLESENYIARTVEELYKGVGIASACGTILPVRGRDRKTLLASPGLQKFRKDHAEVDLSTRDGWLSRIRWAITNTYRGALYLFLQRFIYHGQMVFFGTITNPVGCAVAYRRRYIKDLFDHYEPILGDDLTNSEDIFIGFALLDQGYRNIQLTDVCARSMEPEVHRLPRQIYFWSSSFLQSCYYFDELLRSPFKAFKRYLRRVRERRSGAEGEIQEKRRIAEAYRQPFGIKHSREFGRPMGWILFASAAEKIFFPTALVIMMLLKMWDGLAVTMVAETVLAVGILMIISKGQRLESLAKGILITPLRYAILAFDMVTIGRFAGDLWLTKNRRWRK